MDEDGCGSSGEWNIYPNVPLKYVVFKFITEIKFRWDYVMWQIFTILTWIGIWTKLRIYMVPR